MRWMSVLVSIILVRLMYLVELYNVGMTQDFQNADFSSHSLDICLLNDFFFLQSLDCDFGFSGDVYSESHFPESALADGLA